jgi:hypothetical protein
VTSSAGYEHFVNAPILLPDSKFFPDRWTMDSAGVHRLTRRLLRYAGLGELGVDMVSYAGGDAPSTGHHAGIAGWFAGIVDGRCRFGFDERHVEDDDAIVGVMCHEVAHAFRQHRAIVGDDHDREEEDTDITTVYLGFGVLAANNAYRFRTSGHLQGAIAYTRTSESSIGYLSARSLTFLLAAQVVLRNEERAARRAIANALESNQATFFQAAVAALQSDADALRTTLGVPPRDQWPARASIDELTAPIVDDAPPAARRKKKRRRPNKGQRVFRVVRVRGFFMAAVLGTIGAILSAFAGDNVVSAIGACAAATLGWWLGRRMHADYCSDPACETNLPLDARVCPSCGGKIAGSIHHPKERLEALERLEESEALKSKKKKTSNSVASTSTEADEFSARYEGKPMLIILDSYAFGIIDELPAEREDYLLMVVQRVFGGGNDWRATVRDAMGWTETIDDEIRTKWARFQQMAREQNKTPDPLAFAWTFGDEFSTRPRSSTR